MNILRVFIFKKKCSIGLDLNFSNTYSLYFSCFKVLIMTDIIIILLLLINYIWFTQDEIHCIDASSLNEVFFFLPNRIKLNFLNIFNNNYLNYFFKNFYFISTVTNKTCLIT